MMRLARSDAPTCVSIDRKDFLLCLERLMPETVLFIVTNLTWNLAHLSVRQSSGFGKAS